MGKSCNYYVRPNSTRVKFGLRTLAAISKNTLLLILSIWVINSCIGSTFADVSNVEQNAKGEALIPNVDFKSFSFSNPRLYILSSLIFLGNVLAVAAGIGGGGIFVSILYFFGNYGIKEAIPISKGIVFTAAVIALYINCGLEHPKLGGPVVNLNVVKILAPGALVGTILGVFLNHRAPEIVIIIGLGIFLSLAFFTTIYKAVQKYKQEIKAEKLAPFNEIPLTSDAFFLPSTLDEYSTFENTTKTSDRTGNEMRSPVSLENDLRSTFSPVSAETDSNYIFPSSIKRKFEKEGVHSSLPILDKEAEKQKKGNSVVGGTPKLQERNTATSSRSEGNFKSFDRPTKDEQAFRSQPRLYTLKPVMKSNEATETLAETSNKESFTFDTSVLPHISSVFSQRSSDTQLLSKFSVGASEVNILSSALQSPLAENFLPKNQLLTSEKNSAREIVEKTKDDQGSVKTSLAPADVASDWTSLDLSESNQSSTLILESAQSKSRLVFNSSIPEVLSVYSLIQLGTLLMLLFCFSVATGYVINSSTFMLSEILITLGFTFVFAIIVQTIFSIDILRSNPRMKGLSLREVLSISLFRDRFRLSAINYLFPSSRDLNSSLIVNSNFNFFGHSKSKLLPLIAFIGSTLAGLLGIGAGLIFTPMLLWAEYDPVVAIASASACLLFTAPSIMLQFFFLNRLKVLDTIFFSVIGLFASILGVQIVFFILKRYNRASYLIFMVSFAVLTAIVSLILKSFVTL